MVTTANGFWTTVSMVICGRVSGQPRITTTN